MNNSQPNVAEFTVSELSAALKRTVEDSYGYVRVRGEISGYKGPHGSGHVLFRAQGRARQDRRRDLEDDLRPHADEARRGHGGHRHRQAHHLSQPVELPDHRRDPGAGRPRRADGAARGAQAQAHRRGPVRRGAKAAPAVSARSHRRRHLADRRGDPRHPASARRPLPAPRHRLAGQGAGRRLGRAGRRRHPRLQCAGPKAAASAGPIC